jgi:hypothetical protein
MKNRMSDLRNHLFETLEALKDKDQPMDIDRAKAISEVAQTLINAAKVEVQFLETVGGEASGEFFEIPTPRGKLQLAGDAQRSVPSGRQ